MDRLSLVRMASRVAEGAPSTKEGELGAPVGQVLSHLQNWLNAKYAIDIAYRSFADRITGPWRDSLVDHWYEHAKQERSQAYDLAMKIVGLGGDPNVMAVQVPPCTRNIAAFCQVLQELELKAIENGRVAVQLAGGNAPLRVMAEQVILVDSQHLDDLRRFFPQTTGT